VDVEAAADRALEPLEEGLRNQLVEIVRTSQVELFQSYQAQHLAQQTALQAHAEQGSSNTEDAAQGTENAAHADMMAFSTPAPIVDEDWVSMFPSVFGDHPPASDSAYFSWVWPDVPDKATEPVPDTDIPDGMPLSDERDTNQ
jgi:hypothetical protein